MRYEHSHLARSDDYQDTLEEWTVSVTEWDEGDEDGPRVGELSLFRLRSFTGYSRTMAADERSGELLSIAETVFDANDEYNTASSGPSTCRWGTCWSWTGSGSTRRTAGSASARSSRWRRYGDCRAAAARWLSNRA
ncbi:hypothetical protein ACTVZO_42170 [Streptomyces sp. IBSNAI002]|uniref:hypothetical protein n=1 Tax=Streptomyces sp. IBSNAI002 TaxID=3457500 RepID=UPI003FD61058